MAKILLIDDDSHVRGVLCDALSIEGHTVIEASSGREGLAAAHSEQPDLIISDVVMEGLDGFSTLQSVRDDPRTAAIPLIIITGAGDSAGMRRAMALGANDYLQKPFSVKELLETVSARLKQREVVQRETEERLEELRRNITLALPHELRTPLASILTAGKLLSSQGGKLPEEKIRQFGSIIQGAGQRLHRMVENFLIYAQIELLQSDEQWVGRLRTGSTADASATISLAAGRAAGEASRGQDLNLELSGDISAAIDAQYLERIVEELVGNACKFSEAGSPVAVRSHANGGMTCFVSDEGRGMEAEEVERLGGYMQFGRRLHEQQGSGLGLAIARRLVELHGGRMEITSHAGEGTTVRFEIPAGERED